MYYAIDKITGNYIIAINLREDNYKDTYNKSLRYICGGYINDYCKCNDNNVSFVNSLKKQSHFRHSKNTTCSASKSFKEFNIDFYKNWFNLFKKEYRKPYWYNINLENIEYENNIIMIRYNHQTEKKIKNIETYIKSNKIIWILSLENRKYNKIYFHKGKIYIDFIGNKNDIPIFDNNKSIIYLDTGFDILLKVKLDSYNNNGQEIEIIYIKDFCKQYDELLFLCPYRKEFDYIKNILNEQEKYNNIIIKLLENYKDFEEKLSKNITIEILYSLFNIYNQLNKLDYIFEFNYKVEYDICINKISIILNDIEKYKKEIKNNNLANINNIIKLYIILFDYKKYNNIFKEKYKEYEYYNYINEYLKQFTNNIDILNEYDNICYNYLNNLFNHKKYEKLRLIKLKNKRRKEQIFFNINQKKDEEFLLIENIYNNYKKNYNDNELLNILLNIINNNNEKIKHIKDNYLHNYYYYITHNNNIYKMIKFIIYQEKYIINI